MALASAALPSYPELCMFPVYQAKDLIEAELLLQRLRDRSIPSALKNDFLLGLLGELPLSVRPTVCVLEERDQSAALLCVSRDGGRAQRTGCTGTVVPELRRHQPR